jgi:hypothetical protein
MILSFVAYITSFSLFALASQLVWLFLAMAFFSVGEAFRTGTHKAMIFDWLRHEGREDEKAKVYGYTRSWSQIGSALSALVAAGVVLATESYTWIFWASCAPYIAGILNFLRYPAYLDGAADGGVSMRSVWRHMFNAIRSCATSIQLRGLLTESMLLAGCYTTVKDYLQPLLKHTALALPVLLFLGNEQRAATLVGVVYFLLHLLSALSSRMADRLSQASGGNEAARWRILLGNGVLFVILFPALLYGQNVIAILAFVGLAMLQNLWRPMLLAGIDQSSDNAMGATILSVDSQAKSAFTMVSAPALGLAVDQLGLWSVGPFGILTAGLLLINASRASLRNKSG